MILLSIYGIDWILLIIAGALDFRYAWTGPVMPIVAILGNLLIIAGFALLTWAMVANRSFEWGVRIQNDREHKVIDSGPYQFLRHPGYTGVIVSFYFGIPMALGSWAAFLVGLVGLITMVVRTALEDRTLQEELPGYKEFTEKTRYRLIPGVW
jgi:protein-S-isoprenylcysteine O-methyltransferase Ste14